MTDRTPSDELPAPDVLRSDELAVALGCTTETLQEWERLGLLVGADDRFPVEDLERGRLILHAASRDISAEEIAAASATQGDLLAQFVPLVSGGVPRQARPIEDALEATNLDPSTLGRVWVASGLGDQTEVYDEDLDALRTVAAVLAAGLPEDALVQLIRVYADALGRVGEAEDRLFHYYVHEQLRSVGLTGDALTEATNAVADQVINFIEPTVLYFHRKAFQRATRDDFLLHLREATTPTGGTAGELVATILFVDLAGFTPLTESMGDAAAAGVVDQFSDLVRGAASLHHGRVVKQIGDEFMLVFTDPARAVTFALALDDRVAEEPKFPGLRIGAHHGTVLYREGDYLGTTVNVAARVTTVADRDEFLVTAPLLDGADLAPDVEATPIGPRSLRGISEKVELFRVRRGTRPARAVDPVCHMVLDPEADTVEVTWNDTIVRLCSPACAEQFRSDPSQYLITAGGTEGATDDQSDEMSPRLRHSVVWVTLGSRWR
jgi:class 3 adenylate cyclase